MGSELGLSQTSSGSRGSASRILITSGGYDISRDPAITRVCNLLAPESVRMVCRAMDEYPRDFDQVGYHKKSCSCWIDCEWWYDQWPRFG